MKPIIKKVETKEEMTKIAKDYVENKKYKTISAEDNHIILKKNSYGDLKVHIVLIVLGVFLSVLFFIGNVIYFGYNVFKRSKVVVITTEDINEEIIENNIENTEEYHKINNEYDKK